jgi:hypothetical protein
MATTSQAIVTGYVDLVWEKIANVSIRREEENCVSQSLQANARVVPLSGHDRSLPNSFQIISHPSVRYYIVYMPTSS